MRSEDPLLWQFNQLIRTNRSWDYALLKRDTMREFGLEAVSQDVTVDCEVKSLVETRSLVSEAWPSGEVAVQMYDGAQRERDANTERSLRKEGKNFYESVSTYPMVETRHEVACKCGGAAFPCPNCRGKGAVTCPGCNRSGVCQTCKGSREVPCRSCGASGRVRCDRCQGKGTVRQSMPGRRGCSYCNGSGFQGFGDNRRTCWSCRGSGWVETTDNIDVACDKCGGNTWVRCGTCAGRGALSCSSCSGTGRCSRCSGSGNLGCPTCGQQGTVLCPACHGSSSLIVYASDVYRYTITENTKTVQPASGLETVVGGKRSASRAFELDRFSDAEVSKVMGYINPTTKKTLEEARSTVQEMAQRAKSGLEFRNTQPDLNQQMNEAAGRPWAVFTQNWDTTPRDSYNSSFMLRIEPEDRSRKADVEGKVIFQTLKCYLQSVRDMRLKIGGETVKLTSTGERVKHESIPSKTDWAKIATLAGLLLSPLAYLISPYLLPLTAISGAVYALLVLRTRINNSYDIVTIIGEDQEARSALFNQIRNVATNRKGAKVLDKLFDGILGSPLGQDPQLTLFYTMRLRGRTVRVLNMSTDSFSAFRERVVSGKNVRGTGSAKRVINESSFLFFVNVGAFSQAVVDQSVREVGLQNGRARRVFVFHDSTRSDLLVQKVEGGVAYVLPHSGSPEDELDRPEIRERIVEPIIESLARQGETR